MNKKFFFGVYLGAMLCIFAVHALSQNTFVKWSTFDMGFGISTAPNTVAISALGQAFVGTSGQANTRLESGFLSDTLFRVTLVAVHEDKPLPAVFALQQNYPNPFNPATTIRFELPRASKVSLKVYNVLGQEVITLVDEVKPPGTYDVQFSAQNLASGMYVYRLHAGEYVAVKKLVLLK